MIKYKIDYFYVFTNEINFNEILDNSSYVVSAFEEKQSPFLIGAMANDLNFKYCHQFKAPEDSIIETNENDDNVLLNLHFKYSSVKNTCEYISFIGGLDVM